MNIRFSTSLQYYYNISPTAIAVKVFNALLLSRGWPDVGKILRKKSRQLSEKLIDSIKESEYPSNHRKITFKIPRQHYSS